MATTEQNVYRGMKSLTEIEYRVWYLLESADVTREEIVEELEGIQRAAERLRQEERRAHQVLDRVEASLRKTREQVEGFTAGIRPVVRHFELIQGGDDA